MPNPSRDHGLKLVKANRAASRFFRTGERIAESGIYLIQHWQHRVPHQVTLVKGETFPACEKCETAVRFKLLQAAPDIAGAGGFLVRLYSLPVMEETESSTEGCEKAA